MTLSMFWNTQMFFSIQSYLFFCIYTYNRYHCQIFSLWSLIVDLRNVLIIINLMKLHSTVVHTAVVGKLLLCWPQAPFSRNLKTSAYFWRPNFKLMLYSVISPILYSVISPIMLYSVISPIMLYSVIYSVWLNFSHKPNYVVFSIQS